MRNSFIERLRLKKLIVRREKGAHAIITMFGVILLTTMAGVLAVDMPAYFAAQNQLQTAMDAAALAGAMAMGQPNATQAKSEAAALQIASQNPVGGKSLQAANLSFSYVTGANNTMQVNGSIGVPTIIGKMLCSINSNQNMGNYNANTGVSTGGSGSGSSSSGSGSSCSNGTMMVYASSKAVPAARDTILVIDTSSSMSQWSQPINAVKTAANQFVDTVSSLNSQSVDRVGLVDFNRFGFTDIGLTAKSDAAGKGFANVKAKISGLKTYSSSTPGYVGGWNTNYYIGLKLALDEMQAHGRANANKEIIFLTDGAPNLPAPPAYYAAKGAAEYTYCSVKVTNDAAVKALNTNQTIAGVVHNITWSLPYQKCDKNTKTGATTCTNVTYAQHAIQNSHIINDGAAACGQAYIDYMNSQLQSQITRAQQMKVTVHSIRIKAPEADEDVTGCVAWLARLSANPTWEPTLDQDMATGTKGYYYATSTYDTAGINAMYQKIATDIKVKLASN